MPLDKCGTLNDIGLVFMSSFTMTESDKSLNGETVRKGRENHKRVWEIK